MRQLGMVGLAAAVLVSVTVAVAQPNRERAAAGDDAAAGVHGQVEAVTVYRGQALVTRHVPVDGPAGLRELVVTDLPAEVVASSLYAEAGPGLEVRSVRYRTRPVTQDVRVEVRDLDEQIRNAQDQLATVERGVALLAERKTYLDKLEHFVAPTASAELTRGVLDADTLTALSQFMFVQREQIAERELESQRTGRAISERIEQLQRERRELAGASSRTVREAVVFVNVLNEAGAELALRYLVNRATWSPSYNLRVDEGREDVTVEYQASVQQLSGEDWSGVQMTLSTASPSLVATAPTLEPLSVTLAAARAAGEREADAYFGYADAAEAQVQLGQQRKAAESSRRSQVLQGGVVSGLGDDRRSERADHDARLNVLAGNLQMLELAAPRSAVTEPERRAEQGISVTYRLPERTSLPSRSDRQLIQIASLPMDGAFYRLASPVLTEYVYEEARLRNDTGLVLLEGPMLTYVAGQFVGHGQIPTVAAGEAFTVGLGIDSSLRAGRELVDKQESVQGGNQVVEMTYRLTVENFADAPRAVRLLDRVPTDEGKELRVTLVDPSVELSEDEAYQAQRKKGILRWDVNVPGQAVDGDALTVTYTVRLEHDRQKRITETTSR